MNDGELFLTCVLLVGLLMLGVSVLLVRQTLEGMIAVAGLTMLLMLFLILSLCKESLV